MSQPARVLGIDTALRCTGVGVVDAVGSRLSSVMFDTIRFPQDCRISECLLRLANRIQELVDEHQPTALALEGVFFCRNARTALILGQARGAVIAAGARTGRPMYEYEPRRVKQAVAGFGGATKEQVQRMVMSLLGLRTKPPEDAIDALAIAICHLNNCSRHAVLMPESL